MYYALVWHQSKERSRRREAAAAALEDGEVVFLRIFVVSCVLCSHSRGTRSEVGVPFFRRGPHPINKYESFFSLLTS